MVVENVLDKIYGLAHSHEQKGTGCKSNHLWRESKPRRPIGHYTLIMQSENLTAWSTIIVVSVGARAHLCLWMNQCSFPEREASRFRQHSLRLGHIVINLFNLS